MSVADFSQFPHGARCGRDRCLHGHRHAARHLLESVTVVTQSDLTLAAQFPGQLLAQIYALSLVYTLNNKRDLHARWIEPRSLNGWRGSKPKTDNGQITNINLAVRDDGPIKSPTGSDRILPAV